MSWQAQVNHARPPTPVSLTETNVERITRRRKDVVCKYFGTKDGNYKTFFVTANLGPLGPLLDQAYSFVHRQGRERIYIGHYCGIVLCSVPCYTEFSSK
jgi:hypothetical protein